jgi:hypothetical protein
MCDALSRNPPKSLEVVLAHCLAHARRRVVDVTPSFPAECRHILETLREVYRCDEEARAVGLAPADRLAAHQARSDPLLEGLHSWLADQIDDHRIEPNSGLGEAITYFLKHWTPLTLFLRVPGAPLDNNLIHAGSGMNQGMPHPEICRLAPLGVHSPPTSGLINLRDAA